MPSWRRRGRIRPGRHHPGVDPSSFAPMAALGRLCGQLDVGARGGSAGPTPRRCAATALPAACFRSRPAAAPRANGPPECLPRLTETPYSTQLPHPARSTSWPAGPSNRPRQHRRPPPRTRAPPQPGVRSPNLLPMCAMKLARPLAPVDRGPVGTASRRPRDVALAVPDHPAPGPSRSTNPAPPDAPCRPAAIVPVLRHSLNVRHKLPPAVDVSTMPHMYGQPPRTRPTTDRPIIAMASHTGSSRHTSPTTYLHAAFPLRPPSAARPCGSSDTNHVSARPSSVSPRHAPLRTPDCSLSTSVPTALCSSPRDGYPLHLHKPSIPLYLNLTNARHNAHRTRRPLHSSGRKAPRPHGRLLGPRAQHHHPTAPQKRSTDHPKRHG